MRLIRVGPSTLALVLASGVACRNEAPVAELLPERRDDAEAADAGTQRKAAPVATLEDGAIPPEADPVLASLSWSARSADGRVEWVQKALNASDCLVTVRELASERVLWAAPGCVGRRTQRLVPASDGERLLVIDAAPLADPEDSGRTLVAELLKRTVLVRRWRAFETPGTPERFREGRRLVWVALESAGLAIAVDAGGAVVTQRDGVKLRLAFDAPAREDVLPPRAPPPACLEGPCRFVDSGGNVHVVGTPDEVPSEYAAVAHAVARTISVSGPERVQGDGVTDSFIVEPDPTPPPEPPRAPIPAVEAPPPVEPEKPEPTHFDRVRGLLGLPGGAAADTDAPRGGADCRLETDPSTGTTSTVCR